MWFIFAPAEFFINAKYYPTWEFYFVLNSGLFMFVFGSILNGPHNTRLPKFDSLSVCELKPLLVILYIILLISILALCYRIAIGELSFYKFSSTIRSDDQGILASSVSILKKIRFYLINILLNINYDSSGAYRCYNAKNIKLKDVLGAKNDGYSFFWESLYLLNKKKYSIKEIPIYLPYRKVGSSKMTMRDIIGSLFYLFKYSIKNLIY